MSNRRGGLTWRSLLLGLLLAAALVAITPHNDYIVGNTYIAGNHFPVGAVAVLLLLSVLNYALSRLRRRPLLTARETAVVYILVMVTSGLPSTGLLRYLLPCGTTPYYFASPGNQWQQLFWSRIPTWMAIPDLQASAWFWEGLPEGTSLPWHLWWLMVSRWFLFFGPLWLLMICLAALVRKQWADRERLAFPLVQFPQEILRADERGPSAGFLTSRFVWIGAAAVFLVHLLNGLHRQLPAIPSIPTFVEIDTSRWNTPWDGAGWIYIGVYFSAMAFGYLLPLEVAAGFWVSVLFIKAQGVVLRAIGYEGESAWGGIIADITKHEQMGGLLVLAGVLIWLLRGTLADAFRRAFSRAQQVDDSGEPIGYRWAVYGTILSVLACFLWLMAAGMTPAYAAFYVLLLIAIMLVLTRIIAEAGLLMVQVSFSPLDYLLLSGGTAALGPGNLTVLTFVDCSFGWDLREFLMPSVLNGFRLAELQGIATRKVVPAIALALILCLLVGVPAFLITFYKPGAAQSGNFDHIYSHPHRYFAALASHLQTPVQPSTVQYLSVLVGGAIVTALSWLRLTFVWWPIHPLGFVMATSWASLNLWFSLFLGWLFKLAIIRYAGLRGYLQFRPLFMGVILGDVLAALLWIIIGLITGVGFMVTVI
ncbi:MAG: DUF6785 family protein [Armatimonadota bacterium]